MPYESGKLSVNQGRLRVIYLNHGIVSVQNRFQLDPSVVPLPHAAPPRQGRERRKVNPKQTAMMGKMVQELEFDLDFEPTNPYSAEHLISGAEFAFHGSKQTWDGIYESGGLHSAGTGTNIDEHVHSSQDARSGYVSGTRALPVAHGFATGNLSKALGQFGFVYMFHVEGGVQISPAALHKQAEVVGLGKVPIRDILMFKWLAQPRKIYLNLEYSATPTNPALINTALIAIGGGALP